MGKKISLFLCGDVMTGRGLDQILPWHSDPRIHESYIRNAADYVALAEVANGPIPRSVDYQYIWGDTLQELQYMSPDVRIINLETSVTTSEDHWDKGINYRMHPRNVPLLTAAQIDCCVLANNHVLDWGYPGLDETLSSLHNAGLKTAGAGATIEEATRPAMFDVSDKGRVLVFAFGLQSSGIPASWAVRQDKAGVDYLPDLSNVSAGFVEKSIDEYRRAGDIIVVSFHWGSNWGYAVPDDEVAFVHRLIDEADVNVIYGHSSHHVKGIEVYKGRPIFYGCGDFINDYEGIGGYEYYRGELSCMYFPVVDTRTGNLVELTLTPMRMRNFQVHRASLDEAQWLETVLNREGKKFGTHVETADGRFTVQWQ